MAIKTVLNSNTQPVWHCKKIDSTTWEKPKRYYLNIALNNSTEVITVAGLDIPQTLTCVCTKEQSKNFGVGDRFYYNKPVPKTHNQLQNKKADANFELQEYPTNSVNTSQIVLRYLKGR